MIIRYEYAYRVWYCKFDGKPCDTDGACDKCHWAKVGNRWDIETSDSSAEKVKGESNG